MLASNKPMLYLGLDPVHYHRDGQLVHCPLIKIVPRPKDSAEIQRVFRQIEAYSHIIFSSKNGVRIFFDYLSSYGCGKIDISRSVIIAVGRVTAEALEQEGVNPNFVAAYECQEGIIEILSEIDLDGANILMPRSSLARPLLSEFLVEHGIKHQICNLYDTVTHRPLDPPLLDEYGEVIFTSPSTVDAFFEIYPRVPDDLRLTALGPITKQRLKDRLHELYDAPLAAC